MTKMLFSLDYSKNVDLLLCFKNGDVPIFGLKYQSTYNYPLKRKPELRKNICSSRHKVWPVRPAKKMPKCNKILTFTKNTIFFHFYSSQHQTGLVCCWVGQKKFGHIVKKYNFSWPPPPLATHRRLQMAHNFSCAI